MGGREEILRYLIDACGADINDPGEQGFTPLHLAVKFNYPRIVELLLQRGVGTTLITSDGKTARDLATGQQDRSRQQLNGMLELLDKYNSGDDRRQSLPMTVRPARKQRRRRPAPFVADCVLDPDDEEESIFIRHPQEESVFSWVAATPSSDLTRSVAAREARLGAGPVCTAVAASVDTGSPAIGPRPRRERAAAVQAPSPPRAAVELRRRAAKPAQEGRGSQGQRPPTADALDVEMRKRGGSQAAVETASATSPPAARGLGRSTGHSQSAGALGPASPGIVGGGDGVRWRKTSACAGHSSASHALARQRRHGGG